MGDADKAAGTAAAIPVPAEKVLSNVSRGCGWQRYGDSNPGLMAENHLS
jgi:hypothetical protein